VAEHTLETVMTDHRFETHEPVALYVELGSVQIDVTATGTAERQVEIAGRHADEVDVTLEGADHVELRSTTVSGDVVLTQQ